MKLEELKLSYILIIVACLGQIFFGFLSNLNGGILNLFLFFDFFRFFVTIFSIVFLIGLFLIIEELFLLQKRQILKILIIINIISLFFFLVSLVIMQENFILITDIISNIIRLAISVVFILLLLSLESKPKYYHLILTSFAVSIIVVFLSLFTYITYLGYYSIIVLYLVLNFASYFLNSISFLLFTSFIILNLRDKKQQSYLDY